MEVIFHQGIQKDLRSALAYYDAEGGTKLGDRFFANAESVVANVLHNPKELHFIDDGLRRASLETFHYHFVFENNAQAVRFLVLRHDKRHPGYGMRRR